MTPAAFKRSLSKAVSPKELAPELQALWWAAKGDWDGAHRIVMDEHSQSAAWVHAYLHRVEATMAMPATGTVRRSGRPLLVRSMPSGNSLLRLCFSEISLAR